MSPHYKALRDGNATTIPADYLPKIIRHQLFRTENISQNNNNPSALTKK